MFHFRSKPRPPESDGRETAGRISADGATLALVVQTDEELVIARDTAALMG